MYYEQYDYILFTKVNNYPQVINACWKDANTFKENIFIIFIFLTLNLFICYQNEYLFILYTS